LCCFSSANSHMLTSIYSFFTISWESFWFVLRLSLPFHVSTSIYWHTSFDARAQRVCPLTTKNVSTDWSDDHERLSCRAWDGLTVVDLRSLLHGCLPVTCWGAPTVPSHLWKCMYWSHRRGENFALVVLFCSLLLVNTVLHLRVRFSLRSHLA
jgi:hypothetical protein